MRIIISQEEIEEAIEKLILDQVDVPDEMRIDIALKATRGDEGYTAEIDILPPNAPTDGSDRSIDPRIDVAEGAQGLGIAEKVLEAKREAALPRRRGRPAGARNRPKDAPKDTVKTEPVKAEIVETKADEQKPAGDLAVTEEVKAEAQAELEPVSESETVTEEPAPANPADEPVAPVAEAPQEAQETVSEAEVVTDTTEAEKAPEMAAEVIPEVIQTEDVAVQSEAQPEAQPEPEVLAQDRVTADDQAEEAPAPTTATTEPGDQPVDPAPIAPTRSLFANLGKPVNTDDNSGNSES